MQSRYHSAIMLGMKSILRAAASEISSTEIVKNLHTESHNLKSLMPIQNCVLEEMRLMCLFKNESEKGNFLLIACRQK